MRLRFRSSGWNHNNFENAGAGSWVLTGESLRLGFKLLVLVGKPSRLWTTRHRAADRSPLADSITASGFFDPKEATSAQWPVMIDLLLSAVFLASESHPHTRTEGT